MICDRNEIKSAVYTFFASIGAVKLHLSEHSIGSPKTDGSLPDLNAPKCRVRG